MAEEKPPVTTEEPVVTPTPTPQPVHTQATNGLAIASMIVGIVAFVSGWLPFWGLLAGAAAVVLGVLALKKPTGKGMSIAGIVTGGLAALTSLLFTIIFIVALASSTAIVNQAQNEAQKDANETQQMVDAKKDFSKGETATFGNFEVKVNSVERNYMPESSIYEPATGKEFIVVNMTVKNIGEESEYISPYTFAVNDGGIAVESYFLDVEPQLRTGDLSPGSSNTGNVVYEVTKGADDLKLQYEVTIFTPSYESEKLVYTLAI